MPAPTMLVSPRTLLSVGTGLVLALLAASALAADAEKRSESSLLVQRSMMDVVVTDCASAYPEFRQDFETRQAAWRRDNAAGLSRAEAIVADLPSGRREAMKGMLKSLEDISHSQLAMMQERGEGKVYCQKLFEDVLTPEFGTRASSSNFDSAVGMYAQIMWSSETLVPLCAKAFPEMSQDIDLAMLRWQQQDSATRSRVLERIKQIEVTDAAAVRQMHDQVNLQISTTFQQILSGDPVMAREYCQNRFAELASGAFKQRNPKAFELLEAPVVYSTPAGAK